MGQRFQVITRIKDNIIIYHFQWLWGQFAIRRIGTAIKMYNKQKYPYYTFEDCLKASCYRLNDMNRFDLYFETLTQNFQYIKNKSIKQICLGLDNNDGFCFIDVEDKIKNYTFMRKVDYDLVYQSAEEYFNEDGKSNEQGKAQEKEYASNMKYFKTLNQLKNIKLKRQ